MTAMQHGNHASLDPIRIEISPGELLDRISILEIKTKKFLNPKQRGTASRQLEVLQTVKAAYDQRHDTAWAEQTLMEINTIWEIEDRLRELERKRAV